ncbi:MAG: PEP-CTERM system histidine kinase PrsK, partial [Deltaproteobacteria bacterium]
MNTFHAALSIAAIATTVGYGLHNALWCKRHHSSIFLALSLIITGAVELSGWLLYLNPHELYFWIKSGVSVEAFLPGAWLLYAYGYSRQGGLVGLSWAGKLLIAAALAFPLFVLPLSGELLFLSPDFPEEKLIFLKTWGYGYSVALTLLFLLPIVVLERTYRSLPREEKWVARLEIIGVFTLVATEIAFFGQGVLYRSINMALSPAKNVVIIVAVFLIAFSRYSRGTPGKIRISTGLAFRSFTLFIVGMYLVGMALVGEGLRYVGSGTRGALLLAVFMLTGVTLAIALLSERVRRKINVLIHKHFYENKYDYRESWLAFSRQVAQARDEEQLMSGVLSFYCETFAVESGILLMLRPDGGQYESAVMYDLDEPPFTIDVGGRIASELGGEWVLKLSELPDEALSEAPRLREHSIDFIVPLSSGLTTIGLICLGPSIDKGEEFTYEDFDLMKMLARQATASLIAFRLSEQLTDMKEMAAMGRVSTFVMHDLKNLVSNLSLLTDNAKEFLDDEEFREDMHETLAMTVNRMMGLITRLGTLHQKRDLELTAVDLLELARGVADEVSSAGIEVAGERVVALADAEEVRKVIMNLVINAVEATGEEGNVAVEVSGGESAVIKVTDDGCGMSEEFIER